MGTQYNGIASNVTAPTPLIIASMSGSGTNPTLVTFTTPHLATTGDTIDLFDIDGNTAGNGQWRVTVTSANQISVPVTGNGTYTALLPGRGNLLTYGSTFQIPSDGDLVSASNNNVAPEALGDRSAAALTAVGNPKLAQLFQQSETDAAFFSGPSVGWTITIASANSWTNANAKLATLTAVHATDWLEIDFTAYGGMSGGTLIPAFSLALSAYVPGGTPPAPTRIGGSGVTFPPYVTGQNQTMALRGFVQPVGVTGRVDIWLQAALVSAGTGTITIAKESLLTVKVWRPVWVNQ